MLDEKTIEKMFEKWVTDSSNLNSEEVKKFKEMNEQERVGFALANGFKAAINLLLPIIQKQDEAISFYASHNNWFFETYERTKIIGSDAERMGSGLFVEKCAGKLARSTKQEVAEMIKRLGGEG